MVDWIDMDGMWHEWAAAMLATTQIWLGGSGNSVMAAFSNFPIFPPNRQPHCLLRNFPIEYAGEPTHIMYIHTAISTFRLALLCLLRWRYIGWSWIGRPYERQWLKQACSSPVSVDVHRSWCYFIFQSREWNPFVHVSTMRWSIRSERRDTPKKRLLLGEERIFDRYMEWRCILCGCHCFFPSLTLSCALWDSSIASTQFI